MSDDELVEAIFQRGLKIKKLKEENKKLKDKLKIIKEILGSNYPDNAVYKINELLEEK